MPFLPRQAADSCMRRARRFFELAAGPLQVRAVRNDLRRMALVMAVAALDSYMHGIVMRRISDVRRRGDLPKLLARLEIPFSEIAALADAALDAQRAGRKTRPWVQVKASLQRRLLKETFQSYDQVATAFAIAGIDRAWSKVANELGQSGAVIKNRLNTLVNRRNQIVHEGHMKRASRPRRLEFNKIVIADVEAAIGWVESLVEAIDSVVASHP